MPVQTDEIKAAVKTYILGAFLQGESPDALTDDTPLISGGILDSVSTVKLVDFVENRFGVLFQAHEMSADYLNTLNQITKTVESKM
jgi:acyl carrier protein